MKSLFIKKYGGLFFGSVEKRYGNELVFYSQSTNCQTWQYPLRGFASRPPKTVGTIEYKCTQSSATRWRGEVSQSDGGEWKTVGQQQYSPERAALISIVREGYKNCQKRRVTPLVLLFLNLPPLRSSLLNSRGTVSLRQPLFHQGGRA